jgi:hypothetical protein
MSGKIITNIGFFNMLLFVFLAANLSAQEIQYKNVPSGSEGFELNFPFIGGINNPQFSNIDFNDDGKMDLFVFDKAADVVLPFLYVGTNNNVKYQYAPEYKEIFPKLGEFALLRDYDQDGIMDIFSFSVEEVSSSISVWKGIKVNGKLSFDKFNITDYEVNVLNYSENGTHYSIYVPQNDIPAIDDIDGDGDLDVLSFEPDGGYLYYYKNLSVEKGFGLDSFKFELNDKCWGKFYESGIVDSIYQSDNAEDCFYFKWPAGEKRHAGSTLISLDIDGDSDKDLLLGDIVTDGLLMLTNGGTKQKAWCTAQDKNFPSNNVKLKMDGFLAGFHVDVNNDGKRDLIAAPNQPGSGRNQHHIWLYLNKGTDASPIFEFETDEFLVNETVNMGAATNPNFVDYDADGLMDVIIGANGFYFDGGVREIRLFLLKNGGTKSEPNYFLADANYLDLSNFQEIIGRPTPTFGDMDGDGDQDMIIGTSGGLMIYYENIAGAGNKFSFANPVYPYIDYYLGNSISPFIYDINADGLNDIVVGEQNNYLNLYKNTGTISNPTFESDISLSPNQENLGGIFSGGTQFNRRYGSPIFFDSGNNTLMALGVFSGKIELYNTGNDQENGIFSLISDDFGVLDEGFRVSVSAADIDDDQKYEFVVGNDRGGIAFYDTDINIKGVSNVNIIDNQILSYNNPVVDILTIVGEVTKDEQISIYNIQGQEVLKQGFSNNINVAFLKAGVYFIKIASSNQLYKMVKI